MLVFPHQGSGGGLDALQDQLAEFVRHLRPEAKAPGGRNGTLFVQVIFGQGVPISLPEGLQGSGGGCH